MKRSTIAAIALAVLAVIVAGALWTAKPALPKAEPTSKGTITAYEGGRILVEEFPAAQTGNKCWFAITSKTSVLRQENGKISLAGTGDLAVGRQVSAWATGPIRESYPCQADGDVVLIEK